MLESAYGLSLPIPIKLCRVEPVIDNRFVLEWAVQDVREFRVIILLKHEMVGVALGFVHLGVRFESQNVECCDSENTIQDLGIGSTHATHDCNYIRRPW